MSPKENLKNYLRTKLFEARDDDDYEYPFPADEAPNERWIPGSPSNLSPLESAPHASPSFPYGTAPFTQDEQDITPPYHPPEIPTPWLPVIQEILQDLCSTPGYCPDGINAILNSDYFREWFNKYYDMMQRSIELYQNNDRTGLPLLYYLFREMVRNSRPHTSSSR